MKNSKKRKLSIRGITPTKGASALDAALEQIDYLTFQLRAAKLRHDSIVKAKDHYIRNLLNES